MCGFRAHMKQKVSFYAGFLPNY